MDVFNLLKEDHKKVKGLFKEHKALGDKAVQKKNELWKIIFKELEVHMQVEEDIFYPAVEAHTDKEGSKLINEAFEEHKVVKTLIDEMKALEVGDEEFEAKFKVMMENVEHHIEEEEGELFPKAKKAIEADLEEITEEVQEEKEELLGEESVDLKKGRKSHEKVQQPH